MSYAQVADVKARAGRLAPSWERDTNPSDADIERFVADETGLVDAAIAARGLAAPVAGSAAARALRGVVADGALLLTLAGTFPSGEGPAAALKLIEATQGRYDAAWSALNGGSHVAIVVLEGTDAGAPSASSFWDVEPDYGNLDYEDVANLNPYLAPDAERGMVF